MKTFSPEEIEDRRRQFLSQGFERRVVVHRDKPYEYFVLPSYLIDKALPNSVMRMVPDQSRNLLCEEGDPGAHMLLGVSNAFPHELRDYPIIHEIEEFVHLNLLPDGRCEAAMMCELNALARAPLTPEMRKKYLEMRFAFFVRLIPFASDHEWYTEDDVAEFKRSFDVLKQRLA